MASPTQKISEFEVGGPAQETDGKALSRLDLWLAQTCHLEKAEVSRSQLQRLISEKAVTVNGRMAIAKQRLAPGDRVVVFWRPEPPSPLEPLPLDLDIIYEDESIIVVNKARGIAVHPGAGTRGQVTLIQGILHHIGGFKSGCRDAVGDSVPLDVQQDLRPGVVHRLDKDTTGAIVFAKTTAAHRSLSSQFSQKKLMLRDYLAILDGPWPAREISGDTSGLGSELVRESWLSRDLKARIRFVSKSLGDGLQDMGAYAQKSKARYSKSTFKLIENYGNRMILVQVQLSTGRTHQIRLHARDIGAPVLGDLVYHRPSRLPTNFAQSVRDVVGQINYQMLHAYRLGLIHPKTGQQMIFNAEIPNSFKNILEILEPYKSGPPSEL